MADIADMGGQPERCGTGRFRIEQWRPGEMIVTRRPRPDRGQRHQMRKVQRMDQRLPDIGVDMARQARQPRSEEHTSELQSLMRISYAVFCLKKNKKSNRSQQSPKTKEQ